MQWQQWAANCLKRASNCIDDDDDDDDGTTVPSQQCVVLENTDEEACKKLLCKCVVEEGDLPLLKVGEKPLPVGDDGKGGEGSKTPAGG